MEESREIVVLLDDAGRVVASSRRAREAFGALPEGTPFPPSDRPRSRLAEVARVPLALGARTESLVYYNEPGDLAAYEELRAGFTAAVSHELRTPLARLLVLLETASLPGEDTGDLIEQARMEVEQIGELIDDVLFLSELETGRQVVSLASTPALPVLEEIAREFEERAARAGVTVRIEGDADTALPLRPRMLRVVAENLMQNAVRYAGPGSTFALGVGSTPNGAVLAASDDGGGVPDADLPRLFERFYRADRARASRGTGLGLAIVKHVVTAAGGSVEAIGTSGGGLTIRCVFPPAT
jgi:two-component system, OmpR family, phosphate regulon sensor histidine kinase PhoR